MDNNREIKFRAWHDGGKNQSDACMLFVGDDKGTTHNLDCCRYAACPNQGPHITLMQYTGLKDRNGVEIYEGDIVDDKFNIRQLARIYYCGDRACFMSERIGFKQMGSSVNWCCAISISTETITEGEVIGNIYENPELLES